MKPAEDVELDLEVDVSRELVSQQELTGTNKQLTEFDATPPIYVTSLGRGQWPKQNPRDIRLPRAFYENKGLLSSRAQPSNPVEDKNTNLGRGRILSNYSSSKPGVPSSLSGGLTTTSHDVLAPVDLEEGKADLMRKFLGTNIDPAYRTGPSNKPGHGSLVSSRSGSIITLPDIKCREAFPSLIDGNIRVPVTSSHSDVGVYKEPLRKPSKTSRHDQRTKSQDAERPEKPQVPREKEEEEEGTKTPATGNSLSFKDIAKEIKNITTSYTHTTDTTNTATTVTAENKVTKGKGRGRGRKVKKRSDDDFFEPRELERADTYVSQSDQKPCTLSGHNVLQLECLPPDITKEELVDILSLWGNVLECCLLQDSDTKECIGIAHVRMSSINDCQNIIATLNKEDTLFPGRYPNDASPHLIVTLLPSSEQ